jgi:hypothetical protein
MNTHSNTKRPVLSLSFGGKPACATGSAQTAAPASGKIIQTAVANSR